MSFKGILKLCVSAGLLAWVLSSIDVEELRSVLSSIPGLYLLCAAALLLVQVPVLGYRWFLILCVFQERPMWTMILKATYVGIFFNQVLPGSVGGDVIRITQLRGMRMSLRVAANSVIFERLSGLFVLMTVVAGISPMVAALLPNYQVVVIALILCGLGILTFLLGAYVHYLIPHWRPLARLKAAVAGVRADYLKLLKDRKAMMYILLSGAISWLLGLGAICVLGRGVDIGVPVLTCFFVAGISVLVSVLPISMAGWGVREGVMVAMLGLIEVPSAQALSVSLTYGALMLLISIPGVVFWHRTDKCARGARQER